MANDENLKQIKVLTEDGLRVLFEQLGLGDYVTNSDLIGIINAIDEVKADKSQLPTKVSQLSNDAGYLTEVINISGNAATATKLRTAVNINGVAFDGSKAITVADSTKVAPSGSSFTANRIATFADTTGKAIKDSGFTIATSVPANAKFTDTTYSNMTGASSSATGSAGLVPAPAAGKQASFLRGDGTWAVPSHTAYSVATSTTNGLMSYDMFNKLNGIEAGANKYIHPTSHPASMITQDANYRFVSDTEKSNWNAKETTTGAQAKADAALASAKSYADTKVAGLVNSAPATLDTLSELSKALGDDPNFATTIATQIGSKADTSYVNTELGKKANSSHGTHVTWATAAPKAPGTAAAIGTSSKVAREDHVHPVQTTISGNAGSATKLTSNGGSSVQPVYFSDGKPVACGFTVESVTEEEIAGIFTV